MPKENTIKASARGRRKSLVEEYKAKARGKKTSQVSKPSSQDKKKKSKTVTTRHEPILQMTVNDEVYTAGDVAYYIMEHAQYSKRVHTGEIQWCHPKDNTAPCVTVYDHTMGQYRIIRASLIGWSKAEAKKLWAEFLKENPNKAPKKDD